MAKIIGNALPNIPWQDKPAGCDMPLWRYSENPVIGRNPHYQPSRPEERKQHFQLCCGSL